MPHSFPLVRTGLLPSGRPTTSVYLHSVNRSSRSFFESLIFIGVVQVFMLNWQVTTSSSWRRSAELQRPRTQFPFLRSVGTIPFMYSFNKFKQTLSTIIYVWKPHLLYSEGSSPPDQARRGAAIRKYALHIPRQGAAGPQQVEKALWNPSLNICSHGSRT